MKCSTQFLERPSSHEAVISSFCKFVPCPSQVTTPKTLRPPRGQGGGPQRKCDCPSSEHLPHSATSSCHSTGTSQSATITPLSTAHLQPGYAGRPWEASAGNVTTQINDNSCSVVTSKASGHQSPAKCCRASIWVQCHHPHSQGPG